jgi:hypothetical protein
MARQPKITARKYGGDDAYSWAIFIEGQARPFVSGLSRSEVPYYREQARKITERKES